MSGILAYVDLTIIGYVATFVATLVFSQKIKDFFAGVPAELRSGISSLEGQAKADLKLSVAGVIAKYTPPPAQIKAAAPVPLAQPPAPPVAPAAPAAPVPLAQPPAPPVAPAAPAASVAPVA